MTSAYGSSGSLGSLVMYKYIGHNPYTGRRRNLHSKLTPIHGPAYKCDVNYLYPRSHFSRLQQVVAKEIIYNLPQKVSYDSKRIDPVINGFITNDVSSNLHIYDHSIVTFGKR